MPTVLAALKKVPTTLWIFLGCFVFYLMAKTFGKH